MFNTRLVREEDALLYSETLTQLIQKFGPVDRPKVPSPLHKSNRLYRTSWDVNDTRSVTDWANDTFITLKSECGMNDWPIEIYPYLTQNAPNRTSDRMADGFADDLGRTIIFYNPERCKQIGYFATHMILKLAELRLSQVQSEYAQSPLMKRMAILSAACYNRQGFNLMNLTPYVSEYLSNTLDLKPIPVRLIENTLCFTTSMALRIRRQSSEQIIATYGQLMPKSCRKKIAQANKQIDDYQNDVKLMQMMNEPKTYHQSYAAGFAQKPRKRFGVA